LVTYTNNTIINISTNSDSNTIATETNTVTSDTSVGYVTKTDVILSSALWLFDLSGLKDYIVLKS
jgi:hypothetical protein